MDNVCEWGEATLLIFSENVGSFVYYTHISALVISIFLGFQVFLNNPKQLSNRILFLFTILFSTWIYFDLILWASPTPELVMFFWSAIVPIEMLMFLCVVYLIYIFTHNKKDAPLYLKVIFSLPLLPIFLFGHTNLNVIGLAADCDVGAHEGILIQYMYLMELVFICVCIYFVTKSGLHRKISTLDGKKALLVGIAGILFLSFFAAGNLTLTFSSNPYYEQYKLFGMPIFAAIVAYTIIKYRAFEIKAFISDILITALWILMFSTLLFRDISNARPFILFSTILFGVIGIILSKSIRKEVTLREEIQKLAQDLSRANKRLTELDRIKSEFVSIASHQLRSPITAISGYASLMREGTYGELTSKMKEPVERIEKSARMMALSIEDYLNVSRIESGNMKYNYSEFNLVEEVEHLCDDLRAEALKKNLVLLFRKKMIGKGIVKADQGKVQQIIHNLINNAIKYTLRGSITVYVHDDLSSKKIYIDITDTGVGMNETTLETIFQKFERGEGANSVNISGTGLGLYVALKMTEAMGGTITAHSKGKEEGSRFTLEMPLLK